MIVIKPRWTSPEMSVGSQSKKYIQFYNSKVPKIYDRYIIFNLKLLKYYKIDYKSDQHTQTCLILHVLT